MSSLKKLLFLFFFMSGPLLYSATLFEELQQSHAGEYVVFKKDGHLILFHLLSRNDRQIVIEEISLIASLFPQSWKAFFENPEKPSLLSWSLYFFNIKKQKLTSSYELLDGEWIEKPPQFPFLPRLLALPLKKVALDERKRIGPLREDSFEDTRPFWFPRVTLDGKELPTPPVEDQAVYKAKYEDEGQPLRLVFLYFSRGDEALKHFPYWIEIQAMAGKEIFQVIDSGRGLQSPVMNNTSLFPQ